jgi:predicted O-linked N-acetylglucosamine transferase (SPINDLY family)
LNFADYLSLNLAGDVLLDTPVWSGGKTSLEGLSCGLPLVTLPGDFMRGRHAFAMLKMIGIEDTIAQDVDHYVDIAVRLGTDPDFYREMRKEISNRSYRLFDDLSVPRALEKFFIHVVQKAPEHVESNPA